MNGNINSSKEMDGSNPSGGDKPDRLLLSIFVSRSFSECKGEIDYESKQEQFSYEQG